MGNDFIEVKASALRENPFDIIGAEWMLITAGTKNAFNTMTASWGALGTLWDRNVCFCFIRPQRHTFGFVERADYFTLSFFDESYRDTLLYCGSHSGREVNKVAECGLTPLFGEDGTVYFAEARLVIACRKIYHQDIDPKKFLDPSIHKNYPDADYHRMFVGEVKRFLVKKEA